MTAHFSVVQYVPDPVADERLNIGIIVIGDGGVHCRFLRDWDRAERFGGKSVTFLKEFARSVEQTMEDQNRLMSIAPPLGLDMLQNMARGWISNIQLTSPRGSVLDADALLASVASDFLKDHTPTRRTARHKRTIAVQAEAAFSDALAQRFGMPTARELVTRQFSFRGRRDEHKFDVAVRNGQVFLGAYTLSFDLADSSYLHDRVKITGWELQDVRAADTELKLAVIASEPPPNGKQYEANHSLYEQMAQICIDYDARLVPEDELSAVATEIAESVPEMALLAD